METGHFGDGEGTGAIGGPLVSLAAVPGPALHQDPVGGHEGGVKADTELTDQVDVLFGRFSQFGEKGIRAGVGDGSQVGLEFMAGHADAGIGEGQGVLFLIQIDIDLERHVAVKDIACGEALMPEFFQGIGGIGDQFADEDIPFGIEGVDNDIEEFLGFGLEFVGRGFLCHGAYLLHSCVNRKECGTYPFH